MNVGAVLGWWVVLTLGWSSTVPHATTGEVLAGAIVAVPCAIGADAFRRQTIADWRPGRAMAGWMLLVPVTVVVDTARLFGAACRLAPTARRAPVGTVTPIELPHDDTDANAARAAVWTMAWNASPSTVVVDRVGRRILVHRLAAGTPDLLERAGS